MAAGARDPQLKAVGPAKEGNQDREKLTTFLQVPDNLFIELRLESSSPFPSCCSSQLTDQSGQ